MKPKQIKLALAGDVVSFVGGTLDTIRDRHLSLHSSKIFFWLHRNVEKLMVSS